MAKWMRVKEIMKMLDTNTNFYVRRREYINANSPHIVAYKKEGNKLYIDVDYFKAIEDKEKALKEEARELFYELEDIYGSDYAVYKKIKETGVYIPYNFLHYRLYRNKTVVFSTRISQYLEPFIVVAKEILK